jgi:predicted PurR-regulated permease PerM
VLVGAFLTVAFAFLFLTRGPDMWQWLLGKFGGRMREDVDASGRAAWDTVGGYVRGLTIVAVFDTVGIGAGLLLLGIPLALTLAAMQFFASYIPTIGAFVAGAVAVVVAYGSGGPGTAALVLALVVVVQQIGNDVIEPWVMGSRLPLNAAMVLIAVTAGGLLWGIAGALLFVPLAAAGSAAAHELWVRRGARPIAGG